MKITRAEAWLVSMKLEEPYAIAYSSTDTTENVFLDVETDSGIHGFGCGAPFFEVTKETAQGVLSALQRIAIPSLIGEDPSRYEWLLEKLAPELTAFPSARHAVDMALLDIFGHSLKIPLWKILGGYRDRIATSVTIGILPERETLDRATHWTKQGFQALKIKGGLNWEFDAARVIKVREVVGPRVRLRFDANQGFSAETAIRFSKAVEEVGLECFEQPTPAKHWEEMARVSASGAPVMADESLLSPQDAFELAGSKSCPLFNVKLTKVGGNRTANDILSIAKTAGIGVMLGCMDESALSISAALQLALASPVVLMADLDGHIGLKGDPFAGAVDLQDGMLIPTENPGWGYVD